MDVGQRASRHLENIKRPLLSVLGCDHEGRAGSAVDDCGAFFRANG